LGAQESAVAAYRSNNDVVTSASIGESYVSTSIRSSNEAVRLQDELGMARSLLNDIKASDGTKVVPIGAVSNGAVI
jgi:hypothetical protein